MPVVAKKDEADVLAVASKASCQTRGELVFSLAAAKTDKPQPALVTGNERTHTRERLKPGRPAAPSGLSSAEFQH